MRLRRRRPPREEEPIPAAVEPAASGLDLDDFRRSARALAEDVAEAERRLDELGERLRGIDERAADTAQRA
jgi:hypothetical protein